MANRVFVNEECELTLRWPERFHRWRLRNVELKLPGYEERMNGIAYFDPMLEIKGTIRASKSTREDLAENLALAVLGGDRDAVWPLIDALLESRDRP